MRRSVFSIAAACLACFTIAPAGLAQMPGSSLNAALSQLFGTNTAFTAKADLQVLDPSGQEAMRSPLTFAFLSGRMRLDIDMSQLKGKAVQPGMIAALKMGGLDRVATIVRPDSKSAFLVFNGAKSYVATALSGPDAEAGEKNLQVQKSPLGKETVAGRACTKNKVMVRNAKGATLLEATTWNAAEMKDFPVQIAVHAKDGTTTIRFNQVQMAKPSVTQFDPPAGYKKFASMEDLMIGASQKINAEKKPAPSPGKKNTQPKSTVTSK
jgi:hypothetical protein